MNNKLFSILFTFIAFGLCAQVPRGFSVAAGVNNTMLNSKDLLADSGMGYTAGLGFNCGYHESYNYEFDVLYSQHSMKLYYVDGNGANLGKANAKLATIDLSGQFNYYILKPDEDKFYAGILAGINFSIGGSSLTPSGDTGNQYYLPYLVTEGSLSDFPKITYAPMFGVVAGYNKFRAAFKYNLGLSNVLGSVQTNQYDANNNYTGPSLEGKINSFSVVFYYKVF